MEFKHKANGNIIISVSIEELETINNALNEVCNAFQIAEFQTRMGATVEEVRALLAEVGAIIDNC